MGKFFEILKKIIKRKLFWFILIIVGFLGGFLINKNIAEKKVDYVTEPVKVGDIRQTVSATGTVTSSTKIDLNFETAGKISEIFVAEGDEVVADQILARLESKNALIQVNQARANYSAALANLNKLLAGASSEDVKVSEESMNNAKIAYENAKRDYDALVIKLDKDIETYQGAVRTSETALADSQKNLENIKTSSDQNILNVKSNAITAMDTNLLLGEIILNNIDYNASLAEPITSNQIALLNCETYRLSGVNETNQAREYLTTAKETNDIEDIYQALSQSVSSLNKILISLNYLFEAVSSAAAANPSQLTIIETLKVNAKTDQTSISSAITSVQNAQQSLINAQNSYETQVDTYQASVNTALNNLQTAQTNLNAALANREVQIAQSRASVDNALGAYNLAKAQYDYKTASPRDVDTSYYRAQVAQAKAALDLAQSQFNQYTLRAPADGVVTFVNYRSGEQTSLTQPVISMLGVERFYVEVDIPESDIAKVEIDNPVEITLDAYSDDIKFLGKVVLIYPAETVVQGVVYYKVKVEIEDSEYEIKSGMTANCDILTAQKNQVLIMPYRALREKDGQKFVRLMINNEIVERGVEPGLKGDEGEIEVISGLEEGNNVIIFEKTSK